jgi:hypothetical protein
MTRSILLVAAGILAAVFFACAVPQPSPASQGKQWPIIGGTGTGTAAACDYSSFLSQVQYLANGFDPSASDSSGKPNYLNPPPAGSTIDRKTSRYAAALQNAFQLAPRDFQKRLCALTGIYINGAACSSAASCIGNSWGYRIPPPAGQPSNMTYIGISAGLWDQNCSDQSPNIYVYHCFETDLLNTVFGANWASAYLPKYIGDPSNQVADNFDMVILAALAHEAGHVQWYQAIIPNNPGNTQDYSIYLNNFCHGSGGTTSFFGYSWGSVHSPQPWQGLYYQSSDPHADQYPQLISEIGTAIIQNDASTAAASMDWLYQPSSPWASYFAALSPQEDFVETYKLYILTNAQTISTTKGSEGALNSLKWTYSYYGYLENIPQDYGGPVATGKNKGLPMTSKKPALVEKAKCIAHYI